MPYLSKYLFGLFLVLVTMHVDAQYLRTSGHARMEDLHVRSGSGREMREVRPNESFGHKITIVNNSNQVARFRLEMRPNRYFKMVYTSGQEVTVKPHDSLTVGLKFLNINARVNGIYTVYLDLRNLDDESDNKAYEFNVEVYDGSDRSMIVQPLQENIYIERKEKDFEVPVLLKNLLPEDANVRFEIQNPLQSPYKLQDAFQKPVRIPGKDTIINMRFLTPVQLFEAYKLNSPLTVYMRSDRGDLLGSFSIQPRWLVSTGDFLLPGTHVDAAEFFAQVMYTNYGRGLSSVNVSTGKPLGEGDHFGFNLNYSRYSPTGVQWLMNTNAAYQTGNLFFQAGSVSDFHELSLLGRGFKGQMFFNEDGDGAMHKIKDGEASQSIEFWALDGEYNLLSPFSMTTGSKTMSARYNNISEEGREFHASSSYFIRNDVRSTGHLHFAQWKKKLGLHHTVGVQFAGSSEKFSHPGKDTSLLGYSTRLDYAYTGKRIQGSFTGVRSSRDYSGVLQGATIINAFLNYNFKPKLNLTLGEQRNIFDKPVYTDTSIAGKMYSSFNQHSLQVSARLHDLTLAVKPYVFTQGQYYSSVNSAAPANRSASFRLSVNGNFNVKRNFFSAALDAGMMNVHLTGQSAVQVPSFRFNFSAVSHGFSFVSILQRGPYYLSDLFFTRTEAKDIHMMSLNLGYSARLFTKLEFMSTIGVNQHSNSPGTQLYVNEGLEYNMGKGFRALGHLLVTSTGTSSRAIVSVGLRKTFDWSSGENARVRLTARVFYDRNYNGEKDANEEWAEGVVFKFDGLSLVTGSNGIVNVKNIEKGWHSFSVLSKSGTDFQGIFDQKIDIDHNDRMDIGIPPQFEMTGKVVEDKSRFLAGETRLEGIKISIRKDDKEYFVYTRQDGKFRLFLKPGRYKVAIDQLRRQGVKDAEKEIYIDAEKGMTETLELIWQNNDRKVDVKKIEPKKQ